MKRSVGKSQKIVADHASRYETLRSYVLDRHAPPSRDGLVILLRQGMAAWINAWSKIPELMPQPAKVEPQNSPPIPDDTSIEVVHILAAMALSHFQEVRA